MSDSRARQLIGAAQTVTNVTVAGLPAPSNEGQARELARVPEEQRVQARLVDDGHLLGTAGGYDSLVSLLILVDDPCITGVILVKALDRVVNADAKHLTHVLGTVHGDVTFSEMKTSPVTGLDGKTYSEGDTAILRDDSPSRVSSTRNTSASLLGML